MIINSIYVFKISVKTYNKTLNTQNTQSSNQWQLSDQLYMGGFQFIPKHGHALMTRRNRTVLRDREKVSVDHKRQWLVCFGLRKKMFHVNGLLNMIWPLFNRMGVKGKMISLYICLCSSCHDNLFTMPYVHFMAFYFQTFIPIDNDIWFFLLFLWLEFSNK